MNRATVSALALLLGCGEPPPQQTTDFGTTTGSETIPTGGTTSSTFPSTTFGGTADQTPEHWLDVLETGTWDLTPAGGPWTAFTGTFTLQEIVDELDTEVGPDCLVTWDWEGTESPLPTCPGCDEAFDVSFTLVSGDLSTCIGPDLPPANPDTYWLLAWDSATQTVLNNVGHTGVWVPWYQGMRTADHIDLMFAATYAVSVEDTTP